MKYSILLFLLGSLPLLSQNLILNPDFEDVERCTTLIGGFNNTVTNWSTPSFGTTDLFNTCESGVVGIPNNYNGKQYPKSGANYAGIYVHSDDNYREYIQTQLSQPLEKGVTYTISFYISLAEKSDFAIKNIGFLFSNRELNTSLSRELSEKQLKKNNVKEYTIYRNTTDEYYSNRASWTLISVDFVAKGNEHYVTIGNFDKNSKTDKLLISNKNRFNMSYYYIDSVHLQRTYLPKEVSLIKTETKDESDVSIAAEELALNKEYTFKAIVFDFNSATLSQDAKLEIASVYQFIKEEEKITVIISGHTDNIGSSTFNQDLSERRAQAVVDYFIVLGLSEDNIKAIGYGDSKPITTNKTEEGRHKNRRVIFRIE